MCGIAGWAGRAAPVAPFPVAAALQAIRHRGPDGEGIESWDGTSSYGTMVHSRLAILDLSDAGRQPMVSRDRRFLLAFNGELYNYPDLRRRAEATGYRFRSSCDSEVILPLWIAEGERCLSRFNGIFSIVIADRQTGDVFLARDPIGVKPLVYSHDGTNLWYGSEIRTLAALGAPVGRPDVVALAQFLTFLWIPDPRTPFERAASVEPGHVVRWKDGQVTSRAFRTPFLQTHDHVDASSELAEELRERLRAAVHRQLMSDVPIGLMASGGIDSSLVWAAAEGGVDRAFTICWPADGFEGLQDDERAVHHLEQQLGTPVTYLQGEVSYEEVPPSGDLFADPAYGLTSQMSSAAREAGVPVLLSGQGADELFGGYRRHRVARALHRARAGPMGEMVARLLAASGPQSTSLEYAARLSRATSRRSPFERYMALCTYADASDRAAILGVPTDEVSDELVLARHRAVYYSLPEGLSFFRRALALDTAVYLPGLGLAYADRAGMENGVEIRVPWLDLELVEWALTLPDVVLQGRQGKQILRDAARGLLPAHVATRRKRGLGAPAERVYDSSPRGGRGFRQSRYFARAAALLEVWRDGELSDTRTA